MAKSPTRKKSKPKATPEHMAQVKQGIEKAVKYINDWKQRELHSMAMNQRTAIPICVPISKTAYLVGRFGVKKHGNVWQVKDSRDMSEYLFGQRSTAIAYALCTQTGHIKLARELLQHDASVARLTEQLTTYVHKRTGAQRKKDYWRVDHFDIMTSTAEFQLEDAKNQLEKTLHLAKYFKIWDNSL